MVAKLFYDLSIKEERVDFGRFEQDAMEVAELHWTGESFQDMDIGAFLMDISFRAMRHKVRAPPSYTMFFKGVMTTEGLLLPEGRDDWHQKLTGWPKSSLLANLMRRLPISFGQLLDDFDHHFQSRTQPFVIGNSFGGLVGFFFMLLKSLASSSRKTLQRSGPSSRVLYESKSQEIFLSLMARNLMDRHELLRQLPLCISFFDYFCTILIPFSDFQ